MRSMNVNTVNVIRPISSSTVQNATGATTEPILSAMIGEMEKMANTPTRAIAISRPMARAISLPLNHLAMAFDTVVPAISQPQPNIMNPSDAILALAGMLTHHVLSHSAKAVAWNQSVMPIYFITAPANIMLAESSPVKRTPILSRITPAMMRNPHTLRIYSDAAYVPKMSGVHPRWLSIRAWMGDITSTNI